jgi:uncharacterized membrane protein
MHKFMAIAFIFVLAAGINTIGQIRFLDDYTAPGQEVQMHVNVLNTGDANIDDARLSVYIPETGFFMRYSGIDISESGSIGKTIDFDLEDDMASDDYLVRVRTFTDGHWESRYSHIIVE